jgi:hypothetical protein
MSLELVNTLGTLITVAIVAATAIAAMVQLRHLRAGNQINAMLSISEELSSQSLRDAEYLIRLKLDSAMRDPQYRDYEIAYLRNQGPSQTNPDFLELHRARRLFGNAWEELGILVKCGIVDKAIFLDRYSWVILRAWKQMENVTALVRDAAGTNSLWENFEYLAVLSEDWQRENSSSYPSGVRRMQLTNPWPVPPMPATA